MKCRRKPISFASLTGLALAFTLLAGVSAHALEKAMLVNVRDGKKIVTEERTLTDLESDEAFDGKYFRIVLGQSEEPIRFDEQDPNLLLRAATTYLHSSAMREYFANSALANKKILSEKVTIRIDEEKNFSDVLHFDQRAEQVTYNGSVTHGPSDPFMLADGVTSWGYETWYFKAKKIKRKSPLAMLSQQINSRDFKNMLAGQLLYGDVVNMTQSALMGYFNPMDHLISMAFSVGISELIPQTLGLVGRFTKQKYELDSAMIPEISMHEYTHIALSPVFGLQTSTALNEGFANYFAYKLSGLGKLGARAHRYNRSDAPKSAFSKATYSIEQDTLKQAAWGSFTFALLHDIDQAIGEEAEKILMLALSKMDADTKLRDNGGNNLIEKVKQAIRENNSLHKKAQWRAVETVILKRFPTPQQN